MKKLVILGQGTGGAMPGRIKGSCGQSHNRRSTCGSLG